MRFASRFPPRLLDFVEDAARQRCPIAEINRLVGVEAMRIGVTKPSYERVRQLVHEARELERDYVSAAEILLDVATLRRSPQAYTRLATLPPRRRLRNRNGK
jgi:hypothetical protein